MTSPSDSTALCVIPARLESTRFPNKVLQPILGEPLIRHVWDGCKKSGLRSIIATDSADLVKRCSAFGAECELTSAACNNGTERAAELLQRFANEVFVVVQADMFDFEPSLIKRIASTVTRLPDSCVTAAYRSNEPDEIADPNCVKVVDGNMNTLGFERKLSSDATSLRNQLVHIGMYGYHRDLLAAYSRHGRTIAEISHSLEQLRLFDMGAPIHVLETDSAPVSINCAEDYERLLRRLG